MTKINALLSMYGTSYPNDCSKYDSILSFTAVTARDDILGLCAIDIGWK
jgi:hypothetical protein